MVNKNVAHKATQADFDSCAKESRKALENENADKIDTKNMKACEKVLSSDDLNRLGIH